MSTKTEERIKKILEEHHNKKITDTTEKIGGIFLYGIIVGIIISYSGFLGYFAGVSSGIILSSKYRYISEHITVNVTNIFDNVINQIKKETSKEKII